MKVRLIQPVVISALLVIIVMLYGVIRDLQRRVDALEGRNVAAKNAPPIAEIAKDIEMLRRSQKPAPPQLNFRWIDVHENPPALDSGISVDKGMKADEIETNHLKFERVKRDVYPFSPDDEFDGAKELLLR